MTWTNREGKRRLIALALVAALAMCAGLVRGPTDEDVLADAVRDVAFGDATVSHPAAQPAVHADQMPQAINVIESKFRLTSHQSTLKRGQPVTLNLACTDRTHRFQLQALKIETDIPPRNNNGG